ncbi:MAG TPA: helix-turn-helix domain-containing protein [Roseiarcus sp.]|nr:helix-turn-helix domain-containing protein [Roseiarcus sp.]
MASKEVAVKKYVVRLSEEERARLEEFIRRGKRAGHLLTKARILLKADVSDAGDGWSDSRISEALDTSIATVERTRRQLVEEGFEAVLTRKYNPNSAPRRIFDGAAEAKLIALACGPAPAGCSKWTLRLLEEKVVELQIVESASDNTIGRTLKNVWPAPSARGFVEIAVISLLQRIRPRRRPLGQDGDTRALVLIKLPASSAVF